ncbi:MAG: AraC family transcriptional regulator [Parachlamydiaceae bacterium]|nr:AraC family transcriptional regulator [Parachlamydiaceae bacterium]
MPLEKPEDHANGDVSRPHCIYYSHPDGSLKSYEEIREGTVHHFIQWQGLKRKQQRKWLSKCFKSYLSGKAKK